MTKFEVTDVMLRVTVQMVTAAEDTYNKYKGHVHSAEDPLYRTPMRAAIIAAIDVMEESQWRPISEADKTIKAALVYQPGSLPFSAIPYNLEMGEWTNGQDSNGGWRIFRPTMFQPLPKSPKEN